MTRPDPLPIEPLPGPFDAVIRPPGSKSITCRAYVLAALAEGESTLERPLRSDDTDNLLAALTTLGAEAEWNGEHLRVRGVGGRFPRGGKLNLGDGGAPSRFMIAAACLADEPVVIDGSRRMRERPVAQLVQLLQHQGADIRYAEERGRLPVKVSPSRDFKGGQLVIPPTDSSQFITALMLIGPWLRDPFILRFPGHVTSATYVDMTESMLGAWGATCDTEHDLNGARTRTTITPGALPGRVFAIEPDASSAVYWLTAAAIVEGSTVLVEGLTAASMQPDAGYAAVLEAMGSRVAFDAGGVRVTGGRIPRGIETTMESMPDAAMSLAAAAASATGPSRITGLRTLRVKETDRIAALAAELRRIGCEVAADDESLSIDPVPQHSDPVTIRTYDDHRMAMAFAVLGLARPGISIENPGCVSKSYPTFWEDLETLR
jgi:3-phosphoshikimate 1-carboxyvinyltransferase